MGLLRGFRLLWYSTISVSFAYFGLVPILNTLGLDPITSMVQGDLKLLLILLASILVTAIAVVVASGYLVLGGWKGTAPVPRKMRLLLAAPVGIAIVVLGGALGLIVPIPILPIVLAALLIWATLRFTSAQIYPPRPQALDIDRAEHLATTFWKSRNPDDPQPTPLGATLDGDRWIITLAGRKRTGQLDVDARRGVVTGWRPEP